MKILLRTFFILIITTFIQSCRNSLTDDDQSTADGVAPNSTVNLVWDSNVTSDPSPVATPTLRWTTVSTDFIDGYEVALGSSPGLTDIVGWQASDNYNSHIFDSVPMVDCQRVYATVRSIDITGFPIQVLNEGSGLIRDISPPVFGTEIDVTADDAIFNEGPTTTWIPTVDNCSTVRYEYAIGTSPGGSDVFPFTDIGNVSSYRVIAGQDGASAALEFQVGVQYFSTVRVYDEAGLYSEQRHPTYGPWYYGFDPRDLPNMVAWLNPFEHTTIIDENGRNATDGLFTGNIDQVNDISGSPNVHNFQDLSQRPIFDIPQNAIDMSGGNMCLAPNNHADLNLATVNQRNLTVVFETGGNTGATQIVYEEGGNVRGMNVYISNNRIYCGFYNLPEDGDGSQPFVSVNTPASPNTRYVVTWVFDYTNYTGPSGPDGTLKCYVNGSQIGTTQYSTSLLYAHSGNIGLGCKNNTSFYHTGVSSGNGDYFQGQILELMLFNDPPDEDTITNIHQFEAGKWGF